MLLQTAGGKLPASLNYFVSFSWGSFVFLEKLRLIEYVSMHPQVCVQSQEEDQHNPLNSWFIFCKVSLSFLQNFMTYYTLSQRIIWPPEVSQLFHRFSVRSCAGSYLGIFPYFYRLHHQFAIIKLPLYQLQDLAYTVVKLV